MDFKHSYFRNFLKLISQQKGQALLSTIIAAAIIVTVFVGLTYSMTGLKKTNVSLVAAGSCAGNLSSIVERIRQADNTSVVRNWVVPNTIDNSATGDLSNHIPPAVAEDRLSGLVDANVPGVFKDPDYTRDFWYFYEYVPPTSFPAVHPIKWNGQNLNVVGGKIENNNYQHIRSAYIWASNFYNQSIARGNNPNICANTGWVFARTPAAGEKPLSYLDQLLPGTTPSKMQDRPEVEKVHLRIGMVDLKKPDDRFINCGDYGILQNTPDLAFAVTVMVETREYEEDSENLKTCHGDLTLVHKISGFPPPTITQLQFNNADDELVGNNSCTCMVGPCPGMHTIKNNIPVVASAAGVTFLCQTFGPGFAAPTGPNWRYCGDVPGITVLNAGTITYNEPSSIQLRIDGLIENVGVSNQLLITPLGADGTLGTGTTFNFFVKDCSIPAPPPPPPVTPPSPTPTPPSPTPTPTPTPSPTPSPGPGPSPTPTPTPAPAPEPPPPPVVVVPPPCCKQRSFELNCTIDSSSTVVGTYSFNECAGETTPGNSADTCETYMGAPPLGSVYSAGNVSPGGCTAWGP